MPQFREITSHKVNGLNNAIDIVALGDPGAGGANLSYRITHPSPVHPVTNPAAHPSHTYLNFQNGDPAGGINGLSNEALLAVVEDRLKGFQSGPFSCRENALALTHLQEAMHWLHHRTRERDARGVEGTLQK